MKLRRVEISSYRSIFRADPSADPFALDLAEGVNLLVGPNNCGKSNVIRAIGLVLDPEQRTIEDRDLPDGRARSQPRVELTFEYDEGDAADDLVKHVGELCARAGRSAPSGQLVVRAQFRRLTPLGQRHRALDFGFPVPDDRESQHALDDAIALFHQRVRFVVTSSGETLESILEGRFRSVLREVVEETLRDEYRAAADRRDVYLDDLQQALFGPLTSQVTRDLRLIFPEINDVELRPTVPDIDQTIANLSIQVADSAITDLAEKGTGVRGGVIAAMFRYLAEHSRHSMVFAVEEPEAFLHPAAQENVCDSLQRLAERPQVTVIATTHSPFLVPRTSDARLFSMAKAPTGITEVVGSAAGDAPQATLLGGLFRDPKTSYVLDSAAQVPREARAILLVEGETDVVFLRTAARLLGREADLAGVHIKAGGGASAAATLALVLAASTERPVLALFDSDEVGRSCQERLRGETFKRLIKKQDILGYQRAFNHQDLAWEAEDLFEPELMHAFAERHPAGTVSIEDRAGGAAHLELPLALKWEFAQFVSDQATRDTCRRWGQILDLIAKRLSSRTHVAVPHSVRPTAQGSPEREQPPSPQVSGGGSGGGVAPAAEAVQDPKAEASLSRRPTELETILNGAPAEVRRVKELLDVWAAAAGIEVRVTGTSYAYWRNDTVVTRLWPVYRAIDIHVDHLVDAESWPETREQFLDLPKRLTGAERDRPRDKRQIKCSVAIDDWAWIFATFIEGR